MSACKRGTFWCPDARSRTKDESARKKIATPAWGLSMGFVEGRNADCKAIHEWSSSHRGARREGHRSAAAEHHGGAPFSGRSHRAARLYDARSQRKESAAKADEGAGRRGTARRNRAHVLGDLRDGLRACR